MVGCVWEMTYVISHVGKSSRPVRDGEVCVSPPAVSVVCTAAPRALGDVIIQMDVDLVGSSLCCNGIVDLDIG